MGTSRPGTAEPRPPVTLLESSSPYGSRRVTVEYDGLTTAAYLYDDNAAISATWIANHQPAPDDIDQARLDAGRAPLMPADHVRHPGGRGSLQGSALYALWFEEGDGVAILEKGQPLAVLAGWSDAERGMPGYSRDVLGKTPFGWSLDDALEGFGPRLKRASEYWRWRQSASGWEQFQQALLGHLQARVGPGGHYWDASAGHQPATGVTERPAGPHRPYTILSSVGMSCQRMPGVEQVLDDPSGYARIELALATTLPSAQAARVFGWLATYPWRAVTWFGPGHSVRWHHDPATFPLGGDQGYSSVLLLDSPGSLRGGARGNGGRELPVHENSQEGPGGWNPLGGGQQDRPPGQTLPGPEPPDLSGFAFGGDPVRWLWIIPISEPDRQLAKEHGSAALVSRLAAEPRSWVVGPAQ
jgi:Suppressor of fused protein (SUFU)